MNIEKKMTHIWIGPKDPPIQWMNTWKEKHPDWQYTVFTNDQLHDRSWHNQHLIDEYYQREKYNGVSDLIRYELLYERGGFFPSADTICLHRVDELFTSPKDHAYTVYENEKKRPGFVSPILAANPFNTVVKAIIDTLHKINWLSEDPFRSTGNQFLARFLPKYYDQCTIFPSYTFIPQWYEKDSEYYSGEGKVYAEEYWASTDLPHLVDRREKSIKIQLKRGM